jgi:predicted GNAT family acetyltransferase
MPDLNYNVTNNEKELQFEIELDGEKAYLTYRFYKKDIAFMHTVVPDAFAEKGIASALAKAAFKYAEEQKKPVMVYCPFVGNFLKSHPEYNKQVDKQYK